MLLNGIRETVPLSYEYWYAEHACRPIKFVNKILQHKKKENNIMILGFEILVLFAKSHLIIKKFTSLSKMYFLLV